MSNFKRKHSDSPVWVVGEMVNVGFMQLRIVSFETAATGHRIANLENKDGSKRYQFTPYSGLERVY